MESSTAVVSRNRFYDREPGLSQAVELAIRLPESLQAVVVEAFLGVADKMQGRRVGGHKVLGLYQAQQKRRSYDSNPLLLEMINRLMMVPADNRPLAAVKCLKVLGYLEKYLVLCRSYGVPADSKTVEIALKTYLDQGDKPTEEYLDTLNQRLQSRST